MVAPQQVRVDLAIQTYMDDLLDAASVNDLGAALSRLSEAFGFKHLTIVDAVKSVGGSGSALIYAHAARGTIEDFDVQYRTQSDSVVKFAREADRPVTFDEVRKALGLKGDDWVRLAPPGLRRADGMVLCAPSKGKSFWYFRFVGLGAQVSGVARAVLHVAAELAYWRFDELAHTRAAGTPLTARERQVMRLLSSGRTDGEAADELKISARTVRFHVDNAKRKLGVASRAQAIVLSLRGRQPSERPDDDQLDGAWPASLQGRLE